MTDLLVSWNGESKPILWEHCLIFSVCCDERKTLTLTLSMYFNHCGHIWFTGMTIRHTKDLVTFIHFPEGGQPLGRWEMASILPISQTGDGRWLALSGGGRRDRSPHNPKGDGRFYKNWSVSHWEMGYLSKITHLPVGDWEILTLCPPPPVETKII